MNVPRLVGMALVLVGVLALAQGLGFSSQLSLYLGTISIVVGLVIYVVGSFREMKSRPKKVIM